MEILTGIVAFCAAVSLAACLVAKLKVESVKCRVGDRPPIHAAVFVFFAAIATLSAQKTNAPTRGSVECRVESVELRNLQPLVETEQFHNSTLYAFNSQLSMDDVARGFLLEAVTTNDAYSYAMPTNGVRYEKWWKRGAYEDVFRLDLDGMRFPLKNEVLDSLWVYSWGMAGAHLMAVSNRLVATCVPMSAVPGLSRFWSADAADGAKLLTWENFFLNRDTGSPVSAQLELRRSGDFIARSNNVESLYRRVNPDDWDDDGVPNDEDANPYTYDGDNFGPHQTLPEGANSNAYCWIDVVASGANARVLFSGEGDSNLPDPSFVARAGETNRVLLLIGKEYQASSRMPISCIGRSSGCIEVSQDSPTSLSVMWPVVIEESQMRDGLSFSMSVTPDFLGGGFAWTNSCCSISSSGVNSFTYSCDENCHCSGCGALGYYTYEGYTLPADGGSCGCAGTEIPWSAIEWDDDGPYAGGASAAFSKSAVIFEDPYENTPGSWVGRHSTTTVLHCVAHGGPYGGHVRFDVSNAEKLNSLSGPSLPFERDVSAGKRVEFTVIYEGASPSVSANDIAATATFTENVDGAVPEATTNTLTSVRVEIEPSSSRDYAPNRHVMGVCEQFMIHKFPYNVSIAVSLANGWGASSGYQVPTYSCPVTAGADGVEIILNNARYTPQIIVVEPQGIICTEGESACSDGVIAMKLYPYILPLEVSFSGIDMREIPSLGGGPVGYFTNTMFSAFWHHTTDRGAGDWHHPSNDNFFFYDEPSFDLDCPPPLSSGTIEWMIPLGWRESGVPTTIDVGIVDTVYEQAKI